MRVTLKDIADEAGVSLMTVSNVINGNHAKVSDRTIERIQKIVDARGYVPSASARSLAANNSHLVGLLVPSGSDDSMMLSPHYVAVFGILERQLRDSGYHLLFRGVSSAAEVDVALKSWNLDGAVLLGFLDEEVDRFVPPAGTPILALDSYSANPKTTGVRSDDFEGGRLAARHLLQQGHHRIIFASPAFSQVGVIHQRFAGFLRAHEEAGAPWDPSDIAIADATYEGGLRFGESLRALHPSATAVFATADILAVGLMEGLRCAGHPVPAEVSVIGFDDIDIGRYVTPKLTTIAQDVTQKATLAVTMLLDEIEHRGTPGDAVVVGVRLVERESVRTLSQPG